MREILRDVRNRLPAEWRGEQFPAVVDADGHLTPAGVQLWVLLVAAGLGAWLFGKTVLPLALVAALPAGIRVACQALKARGRAS